MMMELILSYLLWLGISAVAVLGAVAVFIHYRQRARELEGREARLPDSTRWADLNEQVQRRQQELDRLQAEVGDARQTLRRRDEAAEWLRTHEPRIERLEVQRGEQRQLEAQLAELRSRVESLQAERESLSGEVVRGRAACDGAEHQLQGLTARCREQEQAEQALRERVESLQAKRSALKSQIGDLSKLARRRQELDRSVERLRTEERTLEEAAATAASRSDRAREDLERVEASLGQHRTELQKAARRVESLEVRRRALQGEVADLEELKQQRNRLQERVAELADQRQGLQERVDGAELQERRVAQDLQAMREELADRSRRLEAAREEHEALEARRAGLKSEAAELEGRVQEHRRLSAEVARLSEQRRELAEQVSGQEQRFEQLREEVARLDERSVEAAEAVRTGRLEQEELEVRRARLRTEVAELDVLAERHGRLQSEVTDLSERHAQLSHAVDSGEKRRAQLDEELAGRAEQLAEDTRARDAAREVTQKLLEQRNALRAEVAELTVLSETFRELKQSVQELTQRQARLTQQVASDEFRLNQRQEEFRKITAALEEASRSLDEARTEVQGLRKEQSGLSAQVAELGVLSESRQRQTQELGERLSNQKADLERTGLKLEEMRQARTALTEQVEGLTARRAQLEQTVEVLEETLKEMRLQVGYRGGNAGPLSELWKPALVKAEFRGPREEQEEQALSRMHGYLEGRGLRFPERLLHAFHTSMKVAEVSPLVVLAGISGTGKSELVRRYAEGMGMHFLSLAVQPRWDDPQDLFGFFHYLENQYRATDLARALVQMDPFAGAEQRGWALPEGWDHGLSDRMLVVLLDEMNLARVEYYFSEFLSRLEMRRGIDKRVAAERRQAEITLDVGLHGAADPTMRLFVDSNVLFVGTINEDETTQTLSDKVVDRANILSFGRPVNLGTAGGPGPAPRPSEYLPFAEWKRWVRADTALENGTGEQVDRWIEQINQSMELIRKPFAHRTHLAMRSYVANYPDPSERGVACAMADQVEQKILPKFRGLDPGEEGVGRALEQLVGLVDGWGDGPLVNAIEGARRQGMREHQFVFRGVDRFEADGKAEAATRPVAPQQAAARPHAVANGSRPGLQPHTARARADAQRA